MNDDEVAEWSQLIWPVARITARDFPEAEAEDIFQDVWIILMERQAAGKLLDINGDYVRTALFFAAKEAAWNERKQHLTISSQYGYRTSDIRNLFETFFNREDWYSAKVPEDAESEFNVGVEMSSDLSRAWDQLSRPYKTLIYQRFGLGLTVDSKKLSKALSRAADILNNYETRHRPPGPGNRRVVTNAHASYLLAVQNDGIE